MRDGEDGALVVLEELLEPEDTLGVQMVGGLVEQQQVGRFEQKLAEGHATALAAREMVDRLVGVGALQGVHGLGELAVQVPAVGGIDLGLELAHLGHQRVEVGLGVGHLLADHVEAVDLGEQVAEGQLDVLLDRLGVVQRRLLLQDAHAEARGQARLAGGDVLHAGHDLEQGGLAHAVGSHDADLGAGIEAHRDVVEDDLALERLADLVHLVDELCHDSPWVLVSG